MFTHPAHIPVSFALAVHAVMHNTATASDWNAIDCAPGRDVALQWIEEICKANNHPWTDAERQWWLQEFADVDN